MPNPSPTDTVAFAFAWIFIEVAIPMIIPNKFWAGIVMGLIGLVFLAASFGWFPLLRRAIAWKYSLPAFIVAGAGLGLCIWELIPRTVTAPIVNQRQSTDPFLVGSTATSLGPDKDGKHMLVQFRVTVSNRGGMASVVKRWDFSWKCGNKESPFIVVAPVYAIDKNAAPAFGVVDQKASSDVVIPPGGEAYYTLRYTIPLSPDEIKKHGIQLSLTLWDIMDRPSDVGMGFGNGSSN